MKSNKPFLKLNTKKIKLQLQSSIHLTELLLAIMKWKILPRQSMMLRCSNGFRKLLKIVKQVKLHQVVSLHKQSEQLNPQPDLNLDTMY